MKAFVFMFALSFSVLALSSAALAHEDHVVEEEIDFSKIGEYHLPEIIGRTIGDARVNIYDYESHALGSMVIVNGSVVQGQKELLEDPTHNMFFRDIDTANDVFSADSFVKEFNRHRSLNNIRVEAFGLVDQIKLLIGTWVLAMVSIFVVPE